MTFTWPVTADTPFEHIAVIAVLTEDQHVALAGQNLTLKQVAAAIALPVSALTKHTGAQDSEALQDRVQFLARCGWNRSAKNIIPSLASTGLLSAEYTPEQARTLVEAQVSAEWLKTATSTGMDWAMIAEAASARLPVEYLRSMADG